MAVVPGLQDQVREVRAIKVNWNLPPANNGIFHFSNYDHMREYAKLSTGS
jgi:hypothetical protein